MASEELGEATVTGVRWLALMRVVAEVVALGAAVVLARLLSPEDFGHAAVALIFVMLSVMLTFEGSASALIQKETVTEEDRRAAMLISIAVGVVFSGVVYFLGDPLWTPLFGSSTASLIQLVAPCMLIASLGSVSRAAVWRRLDFRLTSIIDVISLFAGSIVSITLAATGAGAKAIVAGGIAQIATTTLLLFIAAPPPLPRWSTVAQRKIAAFGVPASLAALVNTLFRNIDYAILAARLPAAQVGLYYRAYNVGVVYQDKISWIMTQIAFPVYSRITDRDELRRLHERVARVHALVIFPLLASLIVLAPVLIPLVFGDAWKGAVGPTQILAVGGMMAAILTGYPQLLLAIGRPKALLHFQIGTLIVYAGAVLVASRHGLTIVAIAVSAAYVGMVLGAYHLLLNRYVGISVKRLLPSLGPAVVGCLGLFVVTIPLADVLEIATPRAVTVMITGSVGLITYALVVRALFAGAWSDLSTLLVRVLPPIAWVARRRRALTTPATTAS